MIDDHAWRPPHPGPRSNVAREARPCRYMNCGRPLDEHTRGSEVPTPDWSRYQQCPACFAKLGQPCLIMSGHAGGDVRVEAAVAHSTRKLRLTTRPRPNGDH